MTRESSRNTKKRRAQARDVLASPVSDDRLPVSEDSANSTLAPEIADVVEAELVSEDERSSGVGVGHDDAVSLHGHASTEASGSEADRVLADRCLMGEVIAWEELYRQCHDPLCASIRSLLGQGHHDQNLIDDIAARVWYAVVRNDGELLDRFDPSRDVRLGVFFRGLARIEIMQYFRAERRRILREAEAGQRTPHPSLSEWQIAALLHEFAATLTPGEQQFLDEYLLSIRDEDDDARSLRLSDANIWQRRHRIRSKLLDFFRWDG
jgi:hypothetical protein